MNRQLSFSPELLCTEGTGELEAIGVNCNVTFQTSSRVIILVAEVALINRRLPAIASLMIRQSNSGVEVPTCEKI